jgi:hypothetical protein
MTLFLQLFTTRELRKQVSLWLLSKIIYSILFQDRLPLAPDPEPTFVDLEAEDAPSDDLNIRPSHDASSEHETRLSKYYAKQQSSYRGYTVAQDGEEFKEMKARFSKSMDSDPIEEFTPDGCPKGLVKGRVADYENGPKLDLSKVTTKSKMKGKIATVRRLLTLVEPIFLIFMNISQPLVWWELLHHPALLDTSIRMILYP